MIRWFDPHISLWRFRLLSFGSALAVGVLVAFFAPAWLHGTVRTVAAYDCAAIVLLVLQWTIGLKDDAEHTGARGGLEDPGRNFLLAVVLVSVGVGFAAAIIILGKGPNVPAADRSLALAIGIAAVVLGWAVIHTMFVFRYAHVFYYDDADGGGGRGLMFPGTTEPDDYDFAYFSFVIGMTFQVSDVQITDPAVRRVVLLHGLLSFAYNTAILALVVNLASGLFSSH